MTERRSHERFSVDFPCSFGGFFGRITDVSQSGACFNGSKFLDKGFEGSLGFSLNHQAEMRITAKVMWTSDTHCGLKFIKISGKEKSLIKDWLKGLNTGS